MVEFDCLVIGQGLAGTALAWFLRWTGVRVLVVDREERITSSKIAAGLITPITGQRLIKSWRFDDLWPAAESFYRRVEIESGSLFFHQIPMARLFSNSSEAEVFSERVMAADFRRLIREPQPPLDRSSFKSDHGEFEMTTSGQLNVIQYLAASRNYFARDRGYLAADLDPERDLKINEFGIDVPRIGVHARHVIFCQGIDAIRNPWFRAVRFRPAKGEILTVRIPELLEKRVIHSGIWLAHVERDLYRVGSNYEWNQLDNVPTEKTREELVRRLTLFLRLPFEIIDQHAAIRPIHRNQYPVIGLHPDNERLGYFNGLGSKGTLQAPYFANLLTRVLLAHQGDYGRIAIDHEVDLNHRAELRGCHP